MSDADVMMLDASLMNGNPGPSVDLPGAAASSSNNNGQPEDEANNDYDDEPMSGMPGIIPLASEMEDYNATWLGSNIDPEPPSFTGDKHKNWEVYDESTLQARGSDTGTVEDAETLWMMPARVMCVNIHGRHYGDCETFGQNFEHNEQTANAHQKGVMCLLGALTAGEAKGWVNGTKHQELVHARAQSESSGDGTKKTDESKLAKALDGMINSYTYCPFSHIDVGRDREQVRTWAAPSFMIIVETLYDTTGLTKVGYRFFKIVFNKDHSETRNVKRMMRENSEMSAQGRIGQKSVDHRSERHVKASKNSRLVTAPRLSINSVRNMQDFRRALMMYGGEASDGSGRPVIDWKQVPAGALNQAMEPDEVLGGKHCLSPEYILNFRRPGVATAGMVDCSLGGGPINIHPDQADPEKYYTADNRFKPSQFAKDKRCMRILINSEGRDFMDVPLPESMDVGQEVHEDLLSLFLHENRESHAAIKAAIVDRNVPASLETEFRQTPSYTESLAGGEETTTTRRRMKEHVARREVQVLSDVLQDAFWRLKTKNDVSLQGLAGEMSRMISQALADDSLEASVEDIERARADLAGLESYGQDSQGKHILEPPQQLKRLSAELVNVADFIQSSLKRLREKAVTDKIDSDNSSNIRLNAKLARLESEQATATTTEELNQLNHQIENAKNVHRLELEASNRNCKRDTIDGQVRCAKAMRGLHELGLKQFEDAFQSKASRRTIPAGWIAIFEGTRKEFRWLAENGSHCKCQEAANAGAGTANIAFTHGVSMAAKDLSPYAQWRYNLMAILSDVAQVQGGDVRVMMEAYYHAFEVAHPISFYLLLCGGAGTRQTHNRQTFSIGKSMRMERMSEMLVKDWIRPSGPASEMAGQNGEMDPMCGSVEYKDEIDAEFSSNEASRLEYLKRKASDNAFQRLRTVAETVNGQTRHRTKLLWSVHYETTVYSTNRGYCGTREDEEPDANRAPLVDRTIAQQVFGSEASAPLSLAEFRKHLQKPENMKQINILRIISGLTTHVLTYMKHLPFAQPDMAYAMRIFNEVDDIFCKEYNIPRPSPRKQSKRKMTLLTFVVESAVVSKFYTQESASDFKDMLPNADGYVANFSPKQLVDVVESLQMHVDQEKILLALSHSYDHFNSTAAHCFHVKLLLAQLHGCEIDKKRLPPISDDKVAWATPPPRAPHDRNAQTGINQGAATSSSTEVRTDHIVQPDTTNSAMESAYDDGNSSDEEAAKSNSQFQSTASRKRKAVDEANEERAYLSDEAHQEREAIVSNNERPVVPMALEGADSGVQMAQGNHGRTKHTYNYGDSGMASVVQEHLCTRKTVRDFAIGQQQQIRYRNILSGKLQSGVTKRRNGQKLTDHIKTAMTTMVETTDNNGNKAINAQFVDAGDPAPPSLDQVAAVCMPNVQDLIDAGHPENLINHVSTTGFIDNKFLCVENAVLGTQSGDRSGWTYDLKHHALKQSDTAADGDKEKGAKYFPNAAAYSFDWVNLNVMASDDQLNKKQRLVKATDHIYNAAQQGTSVLNGGNVVQDTGLPRISVRDAIYLVFAPNGDNNVLLSKQSAKHAELPQDDETKEAGTFSMIQKDGEIPISSSLQARGVLATRHSLNTTKELAEKEKQSLPKCVQGFVHHGDSQLKLDHLIRENDFVAAIPTDSYVYGQPVRFKNGVFQVHKKYMSSHTQFALLIAADLATKPGVMHIGDVNDSTRFGTFSVPTSLKRPRHVIPTVQTSEQASTSDDEDENNEDVSSLFFGWDMLSMYLTYTAASFFYNDCEAYVTAMRNKFPEVFTEEKKETMDRLPHLIMRYAGRQTGPGHKTLIPLSTKVPLKESRIRKVEEGVTSHAMADSDIAIAKYLSMFHPNATPIKPTDLEVSDWKNEQEGGMAMPSMKGNLFARSTWVNFTREVMTNRMAMSCQDSKALARLRDWGLFLRTRVLTHRIVDSANATDDSMKDVDLKHYSRMSFLGENTWHAIEREERMARKRVRQTGKNTMDETKRQKMQTKLREIDTLMQNSFDCNEVDDSDLPRAKKTPAGSNSAAGPSSS